MFIDKFVENHPTTKTHYQYLQKFAPIFDTEITRSIIPIFNKKHWLTQEELTETMTKKFIFPYRDDLNLERSLYLNHHKENSNLFLKQHTLTQDQLQG